MDTAKECLAQDGADSAQGRRQCRRVLLPSDLPCWPVVKEFLLELQGRLINENISDQEAFWYLQVVYSTIQKESQRSSQSQARASTASATGTGAGVSLASDVHRIRAQLQACARKRLGPSCVWHGMLQYLKGIPRDECEAFLYHLLPRVLEMALGVEECQPDGGLFLSHQQAGGDTTHLSRQFVCSVIACYFLCLFPERTKDKSSKLNIVNFTTFFKHLHIPSQVAKLRCILCYFECIIKRGMEIPGNIVLSRKCAGPDWLTTFEELVQCELRLCPVSVRHAGVIEDSGSGALQVDFANRFVGGGVLGKGRVQEEVRFSTCPELLVSLLFMESLESNEAILISGFEQFSSYTGYAESLCFAGPYQGHQQPLSLVAIDAVSYKGKPLASQYEEAAVLRDLNKALVGFTRSGVHVRPAPLLPTVEGTVCPKEPDGTHDVAADMVTSALTEAVCKAADMEEEEESGHPEGQRTSKSTREREAQGSPSPAQHEDVRLESGYSPDVRGHIEASLDVPGRHEEQRGPRQIIEPDSSQEPLPSSSVAEASSNQVSETSVISAEAALQPAVHPPSSSSSSARLSPQLVAPSVSTAARGIVSPPLFHVTKDPDGTESTPHPPHLTSDSPIPAMTLPAADLPSASALHSPSLPSLVLKTAQGELSHIFFESDSLGNLSRVLIDRPGVSLAAGKEISSGELAQPAEERNLKTMARQEQVNLRTTQKDISDDSQNLEDIVKSSGYVSTVDSSVPPLDLADSVIAATSTSSSSSSHQTGGGQKSNSSHPTAEELETKVSSFHSTSDTMFSTLPIGTSMLADQVDYNLCSPSSFPSISPNSRSLEVSPPLPAGVRGPPDSAQSSVPVSLSLAGSSEDVFQQRSPTSSNVGDSCEDVSSYSNTPRSLDITIPVPVPSLSGPSLERAGSGLSNLSMVVNVDSPTPSCASIDDDFGRMLYVSVDNEGECESSGAVSGSGSSSRLGSHVSPRQHRRLPASQLSPRSKPALLKQEVTVSTISSSLSSSSVPATQPSTSTYSTISLQVTSSSEQDHASVDIIGDAGACMSHSPPHTDALVTADSQQIQMAATTTSATSIVTATTTVTTATTSSSTSSSSPRTAPLSRQNSRDLYVELKEYLSSPNCSSRDSAGSWSGIHPPLSSSSSSMGSRSGSLSSHRGSNGFTGDFLEFWNHYRRRSSQMSQLSDSSSYTTSSSGSMSGTSRRSSSSHKHSTDFSTDLEDISESLLKHSHGVIEEEAGGLGMITDFATQFVTAAVRNGVIAAVLRESDAAAETTQETASVHKTQTEVAEPEEVSESPELSVAKSLEEGRDPVGTDLQTATVSSKAFAKSAIPVPSPSSKRQDASTPTSSVPKQSAEKSQLAVGPEREVKASSEASPESARVLKSSRSLPGRTTLTRRALLGKAYPRAGTLVRQQEVSVHPEDEEQEAKESVKTQSQSSEADSIIPGATFVEARTREIVTKESDPLLTFEKAENLEGEKGSDGLGSLQQTARHKKLVFTKARQQQQQDYPKPTPSESPAPETARRLLSETSPPCPSADSGYLSLLSASGRTDSDGAFQYSPSSTSISSTRESKSQPSSVKDVSMVGELGREEGKGRKDAGIPLSAMREPKGSGATFSVKTLQSGEQKLFATLETKTISFPPLSSTHSSVSAEARAAIDVKKRVSEERPLSEMGASTRPKNRETPERLSSSGLLQKVKIQGSSVPRKRTTSDPQGALVSKSGSRDSGKLTRGDSQRLESKTSREEKRSRRPERAVSVPSDVVKVKPSGDRGARKSLELENPTRKSDSKDGRDSKTRRTDSKSERVHRESSGRSKSSKVMMSPVKQEQATKGRSDRRLSNTSGDGADGSVSSVSPLPSSGASGPVRSSAIPKFKDPSKRSSQSKTGAAHSKLPKPEAGLSVKDKPDKEKSRHHHHHHHSRLSQTSSTPKALLEKQFKHEPFFHQHKSRYVFSDVAAPLSDKKVKKVTDESSKTKSDSRHHRHHQHHHHHHPQSASLKKPREERGKLSTREQRVKKRTPSKLSPPLLRFVSSLAERSLSEAVLEGADIVAQRSLISSLPSEQVGELSDEVYSWFSNKIISQVFSHILQDLESKDRQYQLSPGLQYLSTDTGLSSSQLREIGASSGSPGEELGGRMLSSPVDASATDSLARSLSPTSLTCLTASRATTAASPSSPSLKSPVAFGGAGGEDSRANTSHKRQGSLKMVKFQVSSSRRGSDADAAETVPIPPPHSQSHPAASPVSPSSTSSLHLHSSPASLFPIKPSTNIPIPTRRRSSFDLASLSPPSSAMKAMGFSPPVRPTPLSASPLFAQSSNPERPGAEASLSDAAASVTKRLSSIDLSLDIYQVAANIVDQVFQNIADSVNDPQSGLSPRYTCSQGEDLGDHQHERRHREGFVSNIFSSSSAASPSSSTNTKTTTGTASTKARGNNHNHQQTRRSVSPSLGGLFSRQPMSRQFLTSAFLRVEGGGGGWGPTLRTYQRRSSEPGQTSVQLTLQALNSIKFSTQAADEEARQRKVSRTDDDIGRHSSGRAWRRGSLDGGFTSSSSSSFEGRRRSSCGFKDPMLSRFAEELMKADTSVPELVIVGSRASSTSTGSRRSSLSGFRDTTLANLESELLNTSFTSVNSLPLSTSTSPRASQRRHRQRHRHATATTTTATASTCDSYYRRPDLDRSHSRESAHSQMSGGGGGGGAQWKSDSSDTEYWFPPPRLVGEEFRLEYERQHSQEELQDYASFFAGQVVQEAVCVLRQDPDFQEFATVKEPWDRDVEIFAENLTDQILRDAFFTTSAQIPEVDDREVKDQPHEAAADTRESYGDGEKQDLLKYYGEGARPKVRVLGKKKDSWERKLHAQSPAKEIPPRKPVGSRRGNEKRERVYIGAELSPEYSSGGHRRSRAAGEKRQSYLRLHIPASASAESVSPPRHYNPPSSSSSSLSSLVLPSPRLHSSTTALSSSATSLPVPVGGSSRHQVLHPDRRPGLRVKTHARTIPSAAQVPSHSKHFKLQGKSADHHGEMSSCSSSDTSYDSDNTSSSLLSSEEEEEEEDIGPQGLLFSDETERLRRLSKRRSQCVAARAEETESARPRWERSFPHSASHPRDECGEITVDPGRKLAAGETPKRRAGSPTKRKARQVRLSKREREQLYRRDSRHQTGETGADVMPQPEHPSRGGLCPAVEEFASSLSEIILSEAVADCSTGRWLRFLPCQQPIATGNWGCGSFRGNAQLKFVLQWLAASVARCPTLMYYTFGEISLSQAEHLVKLFSGRTVGEVAELLRSYCHSVRPSVTPSSSLPPALHSASSLPSLEPTAEPSEPQPSLPSLSSSNPSRTIAFESPSQQQYHHHHHQQHQQQQQHQHHQQQPQQGVAEQPCPESEPSLRSGALGEPHQHRRDLPVTATLFDFLIDQLQDV